MFTIKNRDGTIYKNLAAYSRDGITYGDVNQVAIEGNPEPYLNKIGFLYDNDKLVGSGIIMDYDFDKNSNEAKLYLYPLIYDLAVDLVKDGGGNKIRYYDDSLENILADIIAQYRATVANPILSISTPLPATGQNLKYTFYHKSYLEARNVIVNEILGTQNRAKVSRDGVITLGNTGTSKVVTYGKDIYDIDFTKRTGDIRNAVRFDNKQPGTAHIYKYYEDTASIALYGKRIHYLDDARFDYEASADQYVATFLQKNAWPKIEVNSIKTKRTDLNLYDKITINNWEQLLNQDIYITGVVEQQGGTRILKLGTEIKRQYLDNQNELDSIQNYVASQVANIPTLPDYIKETYIDSTEIRSPILAGNFGYISNQLRVGSNGIIIDGVNKLIKSSNYDPINHVGRFIKDDGTFEFWVDGTNYIKKVGSEISIRGSLSWGDIDNRPADGDILNQYTEWAEVNNKPTYIGSTYIDATEIRSPNISGNSGYIGGTLRVWSSGIVIDGVNKLMKSSNYDEYANTGRQIKNDGGFHFGGSNSNFIKWTGSLLEMRGTIKATKYDYYGSTPSQDEGLLRAEASAQASRKKVLRGYFGGDANKQQVSMSRMQRSSSIDATSSQTINIDWLRYQPRTIHVYACFLGPGNQYLGVSNGQAGSVSNTSGTCTTMRLSYTNAFTITHVTDLSRGGNFVKHPINFTSQSYSYQNSVIGYNYANTTIDTPQAWVWLHSDAVAADYYTSENVKISVSGRTDKGLTLNVYCNSGRRIIANYIIVG